MDPQDKQATANLLQFFPFMAIFVLGLAFVFRAAHRDLPAWRAAQAGCCCRYSPAFVAGWSF
jgi:hypothetical protein